MANEKIIEDNQHTSSLFTTLNSTFANDVSTLKPGELKLIKRNGKVVPYDETKVKVAMTKAFLAVEGGSAAASTRIHETVNRLTAQITQGFKHQAFNSDILHIEDIQDQVEAALMRAGEHKVARAYVLYREERRKARAKARQEQANSANSTNLQLTLADGTRVPLNEPRLKTIIHEACQDLAGATAEIIFTATLANLFDGATPNDLSKATIMAARTLVEKEPNHTYVTARLLLDTLRSEALTFLGIAQNATFQEMTALYPHYFAQYIQRGIELGILAPELNQFDLPKLGAALIAERDLKFNFLGLQTLYDRYFIHHEEIRYELPQAFFMRVAMGLAIREKDKNKRAMEFYHLLSSFDYMSATPTLFNSGTVRPQLSSCFLLTTEDDLQSIFGTIHKNAMLSKWAGGLGNDWTLIRAMGAHIKGTNGKSQGIVPFLKVADATLIAVNQGGKRKGAGCAYLETWHLDIEEFLELRKNTGDERRRTHDMHTANWIPDLFMQRVFEDQEWTLFSPNDVPLLHETFGKTFEQHYLAYEAQAAKGEIRLFKKISAVKLWRKMLGLLFETGHPWLTFKDPCNLRSPQQHVGVVHSSNLCTEITLNTSKDEVAVCNLGSVNLLAHLTAEGIDYAKLEKTVKTAIRMLDNVIDINYYSIPEAANSNLRHRPIGLGIMGFQDALYQLNIHYASNEAVEFADRTMEIISYHAIQASAELAKERGQYETFAGSLWSQGILPIDSINLLSANRGKNLTQNTTQTLDWDKLRIQVKTVGMRNSNVMAIAPTATISNICGISQSIEPTFQNLYVKSNLSGEFTVINLHLVNDLKALNLWDEVMVNDLKYFDGSVQKIDRIPEKLKQKYATAFEIDPSWLIEAASRRQKWIDQGQSLNLYLAQPSGKRLDTLYRQAWLAGLKTTYYLRSMGATHTEKATINQSNLNAVQVNSAFIEAASMPAACAIDDPDCEACQ